MLNYTNRIKSIMALHGFTQKTLSKKMGMSISSFNKKLMRTDKAKFNIDEAIKLSMILNFSMDEVFLKEIA